MKKTFAFLMLLLILSTCAFASHRITISFDPFSSQSFFQKEAEEKSRVNTQYGVGAGFGYNWILDNGVKLGADINVDTYSLEDRENFTDVSFLVKAGYFYQTDEIASLFADMKIGLDIQTHTEKAVAVFEFGPEIGADFKLNENLDIFASCGSLFSFQEKGTIKYSEIRVTQTIGLGYTF